ncbi:MAG: ECF-type sigma factor [Gemmataceae bacterium]
MEHPEEVVCRGWAAAAAATAIDRAPDVWTRVGEAPCLSTEQVHDRTAIWLASRFVAALGSCSPPRPSRSLPRADFLTRLHQGDAEAARRLFDRFAHRLIGLARQRLDSRLRGKVDPEDVMQSVFKSFFRIQQEKAVAFSGWDDLWSLLTIIALRKCGHCVAYYRAACRDVRRERAVPCRDTEVLTKDEIAD